MELVKFPILFKKCFMLNDVSSKQKNSMIAKCNCNIKNDTN